MTLRAAATQFTSIAAVRNDNDCGCVTASTPTDAELTQMIDMASDELCRLSQGRVFGRAEVTVRPDRCGCWEVCSCCGLDKVPLWGPDPEIESVKIDGLTLDSNTYAIHEGRDGFGLVRVATQFQPDVWPSWQSLWAPDSADNTFSITYTYGVHIDFIIERAAIELTCYYANMQQRGKNALQKGAIALNYNNTTVSLEERRLGIRGASGGDSVSIGQAMSEFLSIWGQPRSTVWAPELDQGWKMHVIRTA